MKKVFCYFLPVVLVLLFMCFCNFEKTYSNDETVIEEEFLAHTPEFEVSGQAVSGDVAAALETNEWPETFLEKYQIKNIEAIKTEEGSYFVQVEYRTRVLKKETEEYDVIVTCDADAGVPEDAVLSVNEISKEEEGYEKYLKETYQMLQNDEYASSAKMLDISIVAKDGTEIEPEKEVNVEIVYHDSLSVQEDEGIKIIHLTDAPEVIEPEVKINENGDVEQLSFLTDSFSVYSILSSGKTEDLDGEAYAAVLIKSGKSSGAALSQTAKDSSKLNSTVVTVNNGRIFCSGTVSVWHFELAEDGGYYIYAMDGDEKQYLTITSSTVTTSTTKSSIIVQKGTGSYAGMVRFYSSRGGKALNLWGGSDTGGFGPWNGTNDPNEWFTLFDVDEIEATPLTPVDTIDHNAAGVKMRLIDYSSTEQATYRIGGDYTGPVHQGLLNSILGSDGYPETTGSTSLSGLFSGGTEVNHLFIEQTYEETGFYEYSSFKNYAYLEDDGNFTVYEELGTPSNENFPWYRRGNFMPYNKISPGGYSTNSNDYDENGELLAEDDPRNGELLYQTDGANYHFGMYMEANFAQLEDGKKGEDDMLYEFNGDDDLWVYVDDVLLLDIGGIHDAHSGYINYATGKIHVDLGDGSSDTTIKEAFKQAGVFPDGTAWDDAKVDEYFKGDTFADFTGHNMKMFYMERGAGASNLHMRFNLTVIPEGMFRVEKHLTNTDQEKYANIPFAYQAFAEDTAGSENYVPLTEAFYTDTNEPVEFFDHVSINDTEYQNVFYIKPGESVTFKDLGADQKYYVTEIGVQADAYDTIIANGETLQKYSDGTEVYDAEVKKVKVGKRPLIIYNNHVSDEYKQNLEIKKIVQDDDTEEGFHFKISLEDTDGNLSPYIGEYFVKDSNGTWYLNDNGTLTALEAKAPAGECKNGNIKGIPDSFSIVIENVLPDTEFGVTEYDMPRGYIRKKTAVTEDDAFSSEVSSIDGAIGAIKEGFDSQVVVTNAVNDGQILGSFRLLKTSEEGRPIRSVYFELSGTSDYGSTLKEIQRTNANGIILFENIEKGTYTLKETKVSDDWIMDKTEHSVVVDENGQVFIDGTEYTTFPVVNQRRIHNDIKILKEDVNTRVLEGAKFKLSGISDYGNDIFIYKESDKDGNLVFANIEKGTYELVEVQAPEGYLLCKDRFTVTINEQGTVQFLKNGATVDANEAGQFVVVNEPEYGFRIIKESGGSPLSNVEFTLYGFTDQEYSITKTSGTDGIVSFYGLGAGEYTLQETSAPDGYIADTSKYLVKIDKKGNVSISGLTPDSNGDFPIENIKKEKGKIYIIKKWIDEKTADEREEPVIHVSSKNESYTSSAWEEIDGNTEVCTISVNDPSAEWTVWEEEIAGYLSECTSSSPITFTGYTTITNRETSVTYKTIPITKKVSGTDNEFLFEITLNQDLSGIYGDVLFENGIGYIRLSNDETANITIPEDVSYNIKELSTEGYVTEKAESANSIVFTNTEDQTVYHSLILGKKITGEPEAFNFVFNLSFTNLAPYMKYAFSDGTEMIADESGKADAVLHLKADEEITISRLPEGCSYVVTEDGGDYFPSYVISSDGKMLQKGQELQKHNNLSSEKKVLSGDEKVVFTNHFVKTENLSLSKKVVNSKGEVLDDDSETFKFDISFEDLEPLASFMSSAGLIVADEDGNVSYSVSLSNGDKLDFYDVPVGARYQFTESKCQYIASYEISDENQNNLIESESGRNEETEKKLSTAKEVIDENEKVSVLFTNKQSAKGSIKLIKKNGTDSRLSGVTFLLERYNISQQKITNESGELVFTDLDPGVYKITEISTQKGYQLLSEPITAEIPLKITAAEAIAGGVDVSNAVYSSKDDSYYFYNLTYIVTNSCTLDLPKTGDSKSTYLPLLYIFSCLSIFFFSYRQIKKE